MTTNRTHSKSQVQTTRAIAGLLIAFVFGCAQTIIPWQPEILGYEAIAEKNYLVGVKMTANVGEPIIKVQDYLLVKRTLPQMVADVDFKISAHTFEFSGMKGIPYRITGRTIINGTTFVVLDLRYYGYELLVDGAGTIYPRLMNGGKLLKATFLVEPPQVHFSYPIEESTEISKGYQNYEILYGGRDDRSLHFVYREYTRDDLARPAFYQNLVYQVDSGYIRFRGTRIRLHKASSERVVFTVLEDALPED